MSEENEGTSEESGKKDRQTWLFPRLPVRDVKFLSAKLAEDGQGEKMRRTLLLDACNLRDSGHTREKITMSQMYGLTKGGTSSEFIEPTEMGKTFVSQNAPASMLRDIISKNEYFKKFHDRYADKRVPAETLLLDWAKQLGIPEGQTKAFADVIVKNAFDAGLIAKRSGADQFISFEEAAEHDTNATAPKPQDKQEVSAGEPANTKEPKTTNSADVADIKTLSGGTSQQHAPPLGFSPTIHIDVQVHISPESTPEQINAIFAGMAKHLYGREDS